MEHKIDIEEIRKHAHSYLIEMDCKSIGQTYSAHEVELMLAAFATQTSYDAIEQERQSKWIDAGHVVPKNREVVLCLINSFSWQKVCQYWATTNSFTDVYGDLALVTHWQPLPEIPTK